MTTYGEPRIWLDQFPLGESQSFEQEWNGITYPGEICRSDTWSPGWGQPLTDDTYFRIVLMVRRPDGLTPRIEDQRIALCLPGDGVYRRRDRLVDELATIRETQVLYVTQRDPEATLIRSTLQRRQQGLEEELITHELDRYSSGTVLSAPGSGPIPNDLFAGADPVSWFANIARWLLSRAYPNSPLDTNLLPRGVTQEDAGLLYEAIFREPAPASKQGQANRNQEILGELGPGLGLSSTNNPTTYDPSACPVLEIIQRHRSGEASSIAWPDLHHHLAHEVGLTGPLATLFSLVYLHQTRPELEMGLVDNHRLSLLGNRPLTGTRLTGDLLTQLTWDSRIAQWATTLGPITQPSWDETLPYLSVISPNLTPVGVGGSIIENEQLLLRDLDSIRASVGLGQDFLALLGDAPIDRPTNPGNLLASLSRISSIAVEGSQSDFQAVYESIRSIYSDYRLLEEDLTQVSRLAQLGRASAEIREAWVYIVAAEVNPEMAELSVERQSVAAAVTADSLLSFSRSWAVLSQQVDSFKSKYATAYASHHQQFNQTLIGYRLDLAAAKLKLTALELLNGLTELGPPAGAELAQLLADLETDRNSCSVPVAKIDLVRTPQCTNCRLSLEDSLNAQGLARCIDLIDGTLGERNRALSNLLVDKILHGQVDQRMEDFLKIVQASDLSALSNTISEEMISFLRRLLG
ncbi:MAG: hypothetical protein IIB31_01305 [Chloroflexi bacterium]|nr:hypothetical protein [Chloroflexota bacterium]